MPYEIETKDGIVIRGIPDEIPPDHQSIKERIVKARAGRAPEEQPKATGGERASAAVSGVNRGIAGLVGLPVDTAENIYNLGKAAVGTLSGRPQDFPLVGGTPGGSQSIATLLERAGIRTTNPRPDDPASRMLSTAGTIAGGSMIPGAGVRGTAAAATGGALAGEALGPEYTGLGALSPAAGTRVLAGAKNAIAAKTAPTVETFKQAGTMPSVGQATDNVFLHGLENLAAKFPGGSGVMKGFIENQQRQMGTQARTGVPTEAAGRAIEAGIRGEGGFLERTKAQWAQLDNAVAAKIPKGATFQPSNTVQALDELTTPIRGAEKSTGTPLDARIVAIKENLLADLQANNGQMPFEALRKIRSRVGAQIDDALVQGAKSGEMSKLYGALSKDLETAATQAGAGREFARQNNFYRTRMDRIESVLDRVIGKGKQPEDIFKAINPTDPDQANKLRATLRSLTPSERKVISEAVVNRLGRATPGRQDELGEVFSSETFLTNYNKLSPGAKAQLFPDPPLRENVEKIAKASASIRAGKGIYANPSGTAGSFAAYSVYASPIASIATGSLAPVAAGAGAAGTAYLGAKMLTSPKVVEWLAKPIKPTSVEAAAHLSRLGVIYNQSDPELKAELAQYVQSIQPAQPKEKPDLLPVPSTLGESLSSFPARLREALNANTMEEIGRIHDHYKQAIESRRPAGIPPDQTLEEFLSEIQNNIKTFPERLRKANPH
jgi:hypothetical protein